MDTPTNLLRCFVLTAGILFSIVLAPAKAQQFPYKACHLVCTEKQNVSAALTLQVSAPNLQANAWIAYFPLPPDLAGQQALSLKQVLLDNKMYPSSEKSELSTWHRKLLFAHVPIKTLDMQKGLNIRGQYMVKLFSKELVDGNKQSQIFDDSALYLAETKTLNYKSAEFSKWLSTNHLLRKTGERDIDFAWRVFKFIQDKYQYDYERDQDRKISSLCSTTGTDCGGLSFLFCGALRAGGVPARPLVGRWLKTNSEDDTGKEIGQVHVKSEFFAKEIGWVPVDMSLAVSFKGDDPLKYFGKFNGDFVTFHTGTDLVVDSIWFGLKDIPWTQSPLFWVTGQGTLDGHSEKVYWQTRSD